jgi:hypothetical protein
MLLHSPRKSLAPLPAVSFLTRLAFFSGLGLLVFAGCGFLFVPAPAAQNRAMDVQKASISVQISACFPAGMRVLWLFLRSPG